MKIPVLESLFNKHVGMTACKFIQKRLKHRSFPVNIAKFSRATISKNICKQPLPTEIQNEIAYRISVKF